MPYGARIGIRVDMVKHLPLPRRARSELTPVPLQGRRPEVPTVEDQHPEGVLLLQALRRAGTVREAAAAEALRFRDRSWIPNRFQTATDFTNFAPPEVSRRTPGICGSFYFPIKSKTHLSSIECGACVQNPDRMLADMVTLPGTRQLLPPNPGLIPPKNLQEYPNL